MIKTFQHKGLKAFFETGSKAGIQAQHAQKLSRVLLRLDIAKTANDVNLPGWRLHPLT
jgi:proteic killer suppression protein